MVKKQIYVVICMLFFSLFDVSESDAQTSNTSPTKPVNIIVILDTSNRVSDRYPGQVERDLEVVKLIVKRFVEEIIGEGGSIDRSENITYKESLNVVVPNQPMSPSIPLKFEKSLLFENQTDASRRSVRSIKDFVEKQGKNLLAVMPQLYEYVQQNKQTGSDIWAWFKDEAEYYFSENHRNLIVCISDGYLNFDTKIERKRNEKTYMRVRELRGDPNWAQKIRSNDGLLPIGKDFSQYNVKFLMVEIRPQTNQEGVPYQNDFEIIKAYWQTWLNSMGIRDTDFIKHGRLRQPILQSFISAN